MNNICYGGVLPPSDPERSRDLIKYNFTVFKNSYSFFISNEVN